MYGERLRRNGKSSTRGGSRRALVTGNGLLDAGVYGLVYVTMATTSLLKSRL